MSYLNIIIGLVLCKLKCIGMKMFYLTCIAIVFIACNTKNEEAEIEKWKTEVEEVE